MDDVIGILLAGGQSRRMGGGDKCLQMLGSKSILDHIISRLSPQVSELIISANGDPSRFGASGLEVVADVIEGFAGPLAGILSGMEWSAKSRPDVGWIATMPGDAPFLPDDYVSRMVEAARRAGADLACAGSSGRAHPACGLWRVDLAGDLRRAMEEEGVRKIDLWTARFALVEVQFQSDPVDPFFNINRPEDLDQAERLLAQIT